jgi:hypothetical protein
MIQANMKMLANIGTKYGGDLFYEPSVELKKELFRNILNLGATCEYSVSRSVLLYLQGWISKFMRGCVGEICPAHGA